MSEPCQRYTHDSVGEYVPCPLADPRDRLSALVDAAEVLRSKYCETCERIGCGKTEEHCPQVKAVVDAINRAKGV